MENSKQPIHPASVIGTDGNVIAVNGLTKREYFAGLAMQGLMASTGSTYSSANITEASVNIADKLLKALETPAK